MKKIAFFAALAVSAATPAYAAPSNTASATGQARAHVVSPITLEHDEAATLSFGSFTAGDGGTVVVTQAGAGSVTGDVIFIAGSTNSADGFTVGGEADRAFSISTTDGSVTNTADSGKTMDFTTSAVSSGSLDSSGAATFAVGGTLTVPASATAGDYTGTYSATVTYN